MAGGGPCAGVSGCGQRARKHFILDDDEDNVLYAGGAGVQIVLGLGTILTIAARSLEYKSFAIQGILSFPYQSDFLANDKDSNSFS